MENGFIKEREGIGRKEDEDEENLKETVVEGIYREIGKKASISLTISSMKGKFIESTP